MSTNKGDEQLANMRKEEQEQRQGQCHQDQQTVTTALVTEARATEAPSNAAKAAAAARIVPVTEGAVEAPSDAVKAAAAATTLPCPSIDFVPGQVSQYINAQCSKTNLQIDHQLQQLQWKKLQAEQLQQQFASQQLDLQQHIRLLQSQKLQIGQFQQKQNVDQKQREILLRLKSQFQIQQIQQLQRQQEQQQKIELQQLQVQAQGMQHLMFNRQVQMQLQQQKIQAQQEQALQDQVHQHAQQHQEGEEVQTLFQQQQSVVQQKLRQQIYDQIQQEFQNIHQKILNQEETPGASQFGLMQQAASLLALQGSLPSADESNPFLNENGKRSAVSVAPIDGQRNSSKGNKRRVTLPTHKNDASVSCAVVREGKQRALLLPPSMPSSSGATVDTTIKLHPSGPTYAY